MNWRALRQAFTLLMPSPIILGALLLFHPLSAVRSDFVFPMLVAILVMVTVAPASLYWFSLRHGERLRRFIREEGLERLTPSTFAAFWWALVAEGFLVSFVFVHWGLSVRDPSAFTEPLSLLDSLYLTLATFTTTGFGDVAPLSQAARLAVTVQMVAGFALVAVGLTLALTHLRVDVE